MEAYLQTEDLAVGYQGRTLIGEISLAVQRGRIVTLIGPNGSGKSTILKTIIGQLPSISGSVFLDGADMRSRSRGDVARRMAILMTARMDPELMTCRDVVSTGRYPYTGHLGVLRPEDKAIVEQSLRETDALDFADRPFQSISDGQRQRVLLARALCQQPELIVLDEPTSFLDIRYKLELLTILKRMVREEHLAVLMSLHELDLAARVSDTVVCVAGDRIDRVGLPAEIFTSDYIAKLYGIEHGSYLTSLGFPELPRTDGAPRVFVIGGMGSGIPVYHALNRAGIPFAAGVIHENDMEYQTARVLAAEVIREAAFEPVGEQAFLRAKKVIESCEAVFCPLNVFGTMNKKNRELLRIGTELGKLRQIHLDKSDSGDILNDK